MASFASRSGRGIAQGLAGLALLLALAWSQDHLRRVVSDGTVVVPPPPQFVGTVVRPEILKRFLGLRVFAADVVWIDTLLKVDISKVQAPFSALFRACKTIVHLDPDNILAYEFAGLYLSVIKDDIRGATAILREGLTLLEAAPEGRVAAWRIPFLLGYNLMFEEMELEDGARWIRRAGEFPDAPPYIARLAARMNTESGKLEVASRVLLDLYKRVKRPEERVEVERKMVEVASRQELLEVNERFERFLNTTRAKGIPRQRAFHLFIRGVSLPVKGMTGRAFRLNDRGRIEWGEK